MWVLWQIFHLANLYWAQNKISCPREDRRFLDLRDTRQIQLACQPLQTIRLCSYIQLMAGFIPFDLFWVTSRVEEFFGFIFRYKTIILSKLKKERGWFGMRNVKHWLHNCHLFSIFSLVYRTRKKITDRPITEIAGGCHEYICFNACFYSAQHTTIDPTVIMTDIGNALWVNARL